MAGENIGPVDPTIASLPSTDTDGDISLSRVRGSTDIIDGANMLDVRFGPKITEAIARESKVLYQSPEVNGHPHGYLSPGDWIVLERYTLYRFPRE